MFNQQDFSTELDKIVPKGYWTWSWMDQIGFSGILDVFPDWTKNGT